MEKRLLSPKEIAKATITIGLHKTNLSILQMLTLGILAGTYIGFGAHGAITISQTIGSIDVGLAKVLFATVFPVGLMLVVICGAELFTGNNLMFLGVLDKKYTLMNMFKNWTIVYISNFLGSIILASIMVNTGIINQAVKEKAISIALTKINFPMGSLILRAILCNILVVLAVWMATGAKDIISKIFSCWFPVMLFVLSGYEHSVANMYFIPIGKFLGAPISWKAIWLNNLIPVTIGNIIGGGIIIPIFYYLAYVRSKNLSKFESSTI
ncbi:MAG: formate/nitrite transporter family protein [Marinisporobacter sp.]|jgi:formate/nitrite transporter|nr:formate/nitrite transporter family protein [Marinisporobacter sp.]